MPVAWMHILCANNHECENGCNLENDHHVVGFSRFADAPNQNHGQNHDHKKCRKIETKVEAGSIEHVALEVGKATGKIRRRNPTQCGMKSEPVKHGHQVR